VEETRVAGPASFEPTRWSLVLSAQAPGDPKYLESWDALVGLYWRPVYLAVRFRWNRPIEEAKDLTQAFFAEMFDGGLRGYAPERGRFRTFLRAALDNFLRNARRDATRLKRGGRAVPVELADDAVVAPADDLFEREWRRSLFERGLAELAARERPVLVDCFRRAYLDPARPTYREVAAALGIPETDVTNHLHAAKVAMRGIVRRLVRESCESDADFEDEMRELFR
jgi:RNA polymerase sigma-70 factor (ECF subfamily)